MANPTLIVLIGQDRLLAETRQWVFQSSGLQVRTVVNLIDLESISLQEPIGLFVLCDSLHAKKRKQALSLLQTRWPHMQCLVLAPATTHADLDCSGPVFQAGDGPGKLLRMVHQLLAERPPLTQGANDQPTVSKQEL